MAIPGHEFQLVSVKENHTFELHIPELEKLLLQDEIKDLPVVVVSVTGGSRCGKSFLLNFFLRYLASSLSAREDGSWLEDDNEPLKGFTWRSGISKTTNGIIMWSEPFISTLSNGDKVAILLMDTQGIYDNRYSVLDCTTVFTIAALLSSVQIYCVHKNIREDDLQHFQMYTEYERKTKENISKPFQALQFIVKDWPYPEEHPYGAEGGEKLLQENLQTTSNISEENNGAWQNINTVYEKVSCFLLPHPGFKVLTKQFGGEIADIDVDFKIQIKDLVKSLFVPGKLVAKTISGQQIKAQDLFTYVNTYIKLLTEQVRI